MAKNGLRPIINKSSLILILGSFPGPLSLQKKEYYAHPQNHFWHILSRVFGQKDNPKDYKEKREFLTKYRIGLWDMIASCDRQGACDGNIKKPIFNNLTMFLSKYPNINTIFLNGRKAEALFKQQCNTSIFIKYLPSTSPACAQISLNKKLKIWGEALKKGGWYGKEFGVDKRNSSYG